MTNKKMTYDEMLKDAFIVEKFHSLPDYWAWVKLGTLIKTVKNGTTQKQNQNGFGMPVSRIETIQNNKIDLNRIRHIQEYNNLKKTDYYEIDDIALSHINSEKHVGKTALISEDILPLVHGMNLLRLSFVDKKFAKHFWYYSMSYEYKESIIDRINRAVNQVSLNQTMLKTIPIPLPPLAEQQRIVDRIESLFERLDRAKELVQQALDSFENRRSAILHKAFTGELTAKWREKNGVSLDRWEESCLGKLIVDGPQNGLYKPRTAYGQGNLIVRIDNFYDGNINDWNTLKRLSLTDDEIQRYSLSNNDIIVNRVNSIKYLGKSALVRDLDQICVFESNVMRFKTTDDVNNEFLIRLMNSHLGLSELRKNAKHAVNQASINQTDVKSAKIKLPTLKEQQQIISILNNLLEKENRVTELISIIDDIDVMKKTILAKAFRGELGTGNPDDEPAINLVERIVQEKCKE